MTATYETLARPASLGNAATAIFALCKLSTRSWRSRQVI